MAVVLPEPTWTELLDERTPHLMKELVPSKLLPHLNLPESDKEKIICDEQREGQRQASLSLLEKLKKRSGGNGKKTYDRFVRALRNEGLQQSALLLDPHFKVSSTLEALQDENSSRLGILGTAAEIGIRIRLLKEEPDVKYYSKLEQKLLEKFKDVRSDSTLELRNKLHHVSKAILLYNDTSFKTSSISF